MRPSIHYCAHPSTITPIHPLLRPSIHYYDHPSTIAPIHPLLRPCIRYCDHPSTTAPIHPLLRPSIHYCAHPSTVHRLHSPTGVCRVLSADAGHYPHPLNGIMILLLHRRIRNRSKRESATCSSLANAHTYSCVRAAKVSPGRLLWQKFLQDARGGHPMRQGTPYICTANRQF